MKDKAMFLLRFLNQSKKEYGVVFLYITILSLLGAIPGIIISKIIDESLLNKNYTYTIILSSILIFIYTIRSIINYISSAKVSKLAYTTISNIRIELTNKILNLPLDFINKTSSGYLTSRIDEVQNLTSIISKQTFQTLESVFEFILIFIIMLKMNVSFTLVMLLFIPLYYIASKSFVKKLNYGSKQMLEQSAHLNNSICNINLEF